MSDESCRAVKCPRLGEVGLELHKLRIGILEEFLILVVPAVALNHITQRYDVARLSNGRLPANGVTQRGLRRVGIGVAHLRDEVVLHGGQQIRIIQDQLGILVGMTIHELILHRQWRELMTTLCGRLPAVGPFATHHMHLVIVGTMDDISRNLSQCGRSSIETATTDDAPLLVATDAVAPHKRCYDTWELDRGIGTILVIVHRRTATGRPLVGAMQTDVYLLATTEGIATSDARLQLRTHTSDGTGIEIGLDIEVPGFVESAVERQVEGIASGGSITWCKLEIGHREQAHSIDLADGLHII